MSSSKKVNSVFQKILSEAEKKKFDPMQRTAIEWFRQRTIQLGVNVRPVDIQQMTERFTDRLFWGNMYYFKYNPKYKAELPYYDTFPLVVPYRRVPGGFMGINFHYLPYRERAIFLDNLYDLTVLNPDTGKFEFYITYNILNSSLRYKYYRPCIKKYLWKKVQTRFIRVEPEEWNIAMFLPVEQFQKEKIKNVWEDSKAKIK